MLLYKMTFLLLFQPLSHVSLFATPYAVLSYSVSDSATRRTIAHQAPLSVGILQAGILEWVAMTSSRGSSQPRDQTPVSCIISGAFFTIWATREAPSSHVLHYLPEFAPILVIESVIQSNHFILCCPLLLLPSIFPSIRVLFCFVFPVMAHNTGGQHIGASKSILPINIQGWFPLGLPGLISLHSKGR